jgi:hypothetical protein
MLFVPQGRRDRRLSGAIPSERSEQLDPSERSEQLDPSERSEQLDPSERSEQLDTALVLPTSD